MKRKLILLLVIVLSLFFVGCNSATKDFVKEGKELPKSVLKANANDSMEKEGNLKLDKTYEKEFYKVTNTDYSGTLMTVQDEDLNYGVYNAALGQMVIDYSSDIKAIGYQTTILEQDYIIIKDKDNKYTLADAKGNILIEKKNSYINVTVGREYTALEIYDDTFVERLSYEGVSGDDVVTENKVDYQLNRTFDNKNYNLGAKLTNEIDTDSLAIVGLPKYKIEEDVTSSGGAYYRVYTKKDKLVCEFEGLENRGYSLLGVISGCFYYQKVTQLSSDAKKYDYINVSGADTYKYDVSIIRVDLKTGKFKDLDCPYVINALNLIKDGNGKYNLASASITLIENERLSKNCVCIVDKNLKIKYNTDIDLDNLYKLGKSHYFDETSETLYNRNAKEIITFDNDLRYISTLTALEIIVCKRNGKLGAIDYNGKVVIPFEYESIGSLGYGDKAVVRDLDGKTVLYNLSKGEVTIEHEIKGMMGIFYYYLDGENNYHYCYLDGKEAFVSSTFASYSKYQTNEGITFVYSYKYNSTDRVFTQVTK